MDRFTSMDVFVRVAEEHGFTAAARNLELSKSVVSKHVQALERRLGIRLFNRTTRRLSLTEAGARYYEHCTRILEEIGEAERSVSALYAQPRGLLRVNVPVSFGHLHLGALLPDFLAHYPEVTVDVSMNDRFVDLVNEGYDAAVRIGRLDDSSLIARRIAPTELWICASPAYLEAHGTPRTPADLARHNCLLYAYSRQSGEWRLRSPGDEWQRVPVRGTVRANNGELLVEAAVRGSGIVMSPDFICACDVQRGRLVRILADYQAPPGGINVVYPYTRNVSAKVRAFVDFLVERFGNHPEWLARAERSSPSPPAPLAGG